MSEHFRRRGLHVPQQPMSAIVAIASPAPTSSHDTLSGKTGTRKWSYVTSDAPITMTHSAMPSKQSSPSSANVLAEKVAQPIFSGGGRERDLK